MQGEQEEEQDPGKEAEWCLSPAEQSALREAATTLQGAAAAAVVAAEQWGLH